MLSKVDTSAPSRARYLLFRVRGDRRFHRVSLPVTIGGAADCDVVLGNVDSQSLAYVVRDGGAIPACFGVRTKVDQPPSVLDSLGVTVLGTPSASASGRLGRLALEALAVEAYRFSRLSPRIRRLLGGPLPQRIRLVCWCAAAVSVIALACLALSAPAHPDLSEAPLALTFGVPRLELIGASPIRHGFERGATLAFEAPAGTEQVNTLLSFQAMALNQPKELSVSINGKPIFVSTVEPECLDTPCAKQIAVPAGVVKAGPNLIKLRHAFPDSGYMVQNVSVQPLPALSPEEREQAARWLNLARRFYDERGIVSDNLLAARINVERALDLLGRRASTDADVAPVKVLKSEVDSAFAAVVHEAWADVGLHERLGRRDALKKSLDVLIRLFPDPSTPENQAVKAKLDALRETEP